MNDMKTTITNNDAWSWPASLLTCGRLLAMLGAVAFATSILSCSRSDREQHLSVLRIGILPDESERSLMARHGPLQSFLAAQIGIPCELIIPDSYEHLLRQFHDQKVDLAYFGGLTFLKASTADDAVPLVSRDCDHNFTSYVLVRSQSAARHLKDVSGMRLSFGSELSTSGHLMPRHFLLERGINPEMFFAEVRYSGAHDLTAQHVRDGVVDVGVANARVIDQMFDDGVLSRDEVRVLWETPPYVDYVWAIQPGIAPRMRRKIRDAFLSLSVANREHASILGQQRARAFLPTTNKDFRDLTRIATELKLLEATK